jgi:uncharacterized protein involved in exopolysaccharide biosynthesis
MLLGQLSVEQTLATNLVNVKLTTTNPEIAPKVTDMVAAVFIEQDKERAMQGQKDTYTDLTKSIEELRVDIAQKEQERLMQMKNSGLPLAEKGGDLASQRLQQMSTQWLTAEDNRRKAQALYEAAVQASQRGAKTRRSDRSEQKSQHYRRFPDFDGGRHRSGFPVRLS